MLTSARNKTGAGLAITLHLTQTSPSKAALPLALVFFFLFSIYRDLKSSFPFSCLFLFLLPLECQRPGGRALSGLVRGLGQCVWMSVGSGLR